MKHTLPFFSLLLFISVAGKKLQAQKAISRDWTSFVQTINVSTNEDIKFRVVAWAKTVSNDDSSWSGIWARVDTKDQEQGFFDNMGDRPIITDEWKSYTIEGEIGPNAERISFGGLCSGNGKFYYDKFEVFTEKPDGTFESLDIKNSSFEKSLSQNTLLDWIQGIIDKEPVKVAEYTFSATEDSIDGDYSLLIEGANVARDTSYEIGPKEGFSPQIGTLISMLDNLSQRVRRTVGALGQQELDYLMDEKANSIGALIMHLVATEVYYQKLTFENISYEDADEEKWKTALDLGEEGRRTLNGHDANYYFDIWKKVRAKTIEEFKKKDDNWLSESVPGSELSNHYAWFHVMEHQSSHLGQMLLLRKRIPEFPMAIQVKEEIKD